MTASQAQVAVGVRGGVNWAKFAAEAGSFEGSGTRLGPTGAIIIGVTLSERFSLVPEIGFIQRGFKQDTPGGALRTGFGYDANGNYSYGYFYSPGPTYLDHHLVLDYVDLAALAKFQLGHAPARPHLLAGVTAGWMTGARQYEAGQEGQKYDGQVLDPKALDMNRFNLGLCGGAGFTFTIGSSHLFLEGRYLYGLTNVWNGVVVRDINGGLVGTLNGYDRSIQCTAGWMIPLGKRVVADGAKAAPTQ